jgi:hypothetical protein
MIRASFATVCLTSLIALTRSQSTLLPIPFDDPTTPAEELECLGADDDGDSCLLKLADNRNSCWGTVTVGCSDTLSFFFGADGQYDYSIGNYGDRRSLLQGEEESEEENLPFSSLVVGGGGGGRVAYASSSLGEGAEDVTSISLRGAKRIL